MKIKFLKDFIAAQSDDYSDMHAIFIERGDIVDVDGCKYNGHYFDMPKAQAQWLIDNGFAEEVKESGWWRPKDGEEYYAVSSHGVVGKATFDPEGRLDCEAISMGNVFKTEEAAERYRDYLKAITTVRQDEGVIDLQGIGEKYETTPENKYNDFSVYTVAFDLYLRKLVVIDSNEHITANAIWFDTEEHAQASLDNHPDEWKTIVNYDWGRETEYVYKERYAELSNNGKEGK